MRWIRGFALLGFAVVLSGCFDDPVRQNMVLSVPMDGPPQLSLTVELDWDGRDRLKSRLLELEADLLSNRGSWDERLRKLEPTGEQLRWTKSEGRLESWQRILEVDWNRLPDLFLEDGITLQVSEERGARVLELYPPAVVASRRVDRLQAERVLQLWSEQLLDYMQTLARLYAALESYPQWDIAVFRVLFEDSSVEDEGLPRELGLLIEELSERASKVWEVLWVGRGEVESWEALSRRVWDPFPAGFGVVLAPELGGAREVTGFEEDEGSYQVPTTSLWNAWSRVSADWIVPDILLMSEDLSEEDQVAEELASLPRRWDVPDSVNQVSEGLLEALQPPSELRMVWSLPTEGTLENNR